MILPLGHETQQSRRLPWITIGILIVNLVVFIVTDRMNAALQVDFTAVATEAVAFYEEHPYLEPAPPLDRLRLPTTRAGGRVPAATVEQEQARLDALCATLIAIRHQAPSERFGYVPARRNAAGLITSQFMHGGWLHLVFNMWFLWLVGCNLEDAWGRALFPVLYLTAGVVAVFAHAMAAPQSQVPLIGASGAVAGAMGAFTLRFAGTRIRFLWLLFLRPIFFTARAYLMLPLWAAMEILSGWLTPANAGGVAHWAHVGGFGYGFAFALVLRLSGLDKRLDRAIEGKVTFEQDPRIVEAGELISRGSPEAAIPLLDEVAREAPGKVEVHLELLRAALGARDQGRTLKAYTRLIELYLHEGSAPTALTLFAETESSGITEKLPKALRLRVARQLERDGAANRAAAVYTGVHGGLGHDEPGLQALVAHAQLAVRTGRKAEATDLYLAAQRSTVPHLHLDSLIDRGLREASALP